MLSYVEKIQDLINIFEGKGHQKGSVRWTKECLRNQITKIMKFNTQCPYIIKIMSNIWGLSKKELKSLGNWRVKIEGGRET